MSVFPQQVYVCANGKDYERIFTLSVDTETGLTLYYWYTSSKSEAI